MASWEAIGVIETKRGKCYTKSGAGGDTRAVRARGKKKARYGSGLNLSLGGE
jgi:hypothetical protein